jgi:nucleotide-binding universal stress UspA family protein
VGIASQYQASLSLVNVVAPAHDAYRVRAACDDARQRLEQVRRTASVNADSHIAVGTVAEEVAGIARRLRSDLLVIGRGHLKGGGRLRSTAYAILRESPCPVVSV